MNEETGPGLLTHWRDFLLASAHILARHPSLLFQEAANLPPSSPPTMAAHKRWIKGRENRPWIRNIHSPDSRPSCRLTITGHSGQINACAFSPGGNSVASTATDGTTRLWDTGTGRTLLTLATSDDTDWAPVFLSRNRVLVQGPDHSLRVHDCTSGNVVVEVEGGGDIISAVAVTPDENVLAYGNSEGEVGIWDLRKGRLRARLQQHSNWIRGCVFSTDGQRLATSSWDMTARLWDAESCAELAVIEGSSADAAQTLAFTPDSRRLIAAAGLTLQTIDARTGGDLRSFRLRETGGTNAVFIVAPGDRIIVACAGVMRIHGTATLEPGQVLGRHESGEEVMTLAISPDGRTLASAGFDETIELWDLEGARRIGRLMGHTEVVRSVAFSPDGGLLASASWDHTIRLWDVRSAAGGEVQRIDICQFTPHGRLAVVTRSEELLGVDTRGYAFTQDKTRLRIRDASIGTELPVVEGPWSRQHQSARWLISPDGSAALFPDPDAGARVFDLETGQQIAILGAPEVEAFAMWQKSGLIMTVSSGQRGGRREQRLRISDLEDREVAEWPMPRDHQASWCALAAGGETIVTADTISRRLLLWRTTGAVRFAEFEIDAIDLPCTLSADGTQLVLRSGSRTLQAIDAVTGATVCTLTHPAEVLTWTSGNHDDQIVSASADGVVQVWDVRDCRVAGRYSLNVPIDRRARLSPDGARLLLLPESEWTRDEKHVSQRVEVEVLDVKHGRVTGRFFTPGDISGAEWGPDGSRMSVMTRNGLALLLAPEGPGPA